MMIVMMMIVMIVMNLMVVMMSLMVLIIIMTIVMMMMMMMMMIVVMMMMMMMDFTAISLSIYNICLPTSTTTTTISSSTITTTTSYTTTSSTITYLPTYPSPDEINHPDKLSLEATMINQNFSQQILLDLDENRKSVSNYDDDDVKYMIMMLLTM